MRMSTSGVFPLMHHETEVAVDRQNQDNDIHCLNNVTTHKSQYLKINLEWMVIGRLCHQGDPKQMWPVLCCITLHEAKGRICS